MQRPGIPSAGVAYLRKVVTDGMVDAIAVVRPDVPTYDETGFATGTITNTPGYIGPAHVHVTSQSETITVGDTMEPMAVVQVSIPFDASPVPRNEDHVLVTALGPLGDPSLFGETLRIVNVSGGGLGFISRTLTCVFEQASPFDPSA